MANTQDSRIRLKRTDTAGTVPTAAPSTDHTDGTWVATDLYVGELYLNETDNRLYVRTTGEILEVGTGGELKRAQITLTTAQVLALNSTPITIVSATSGKEIQVVSASAHLKYNSITYATNVNLVLKSSSAGATEYQAKYDISYGSDVLGTFESTGLQANIVTGDALVATVLSGDPTAGDSDIVVDVMYRVTDLP